MDLADSDQPLSYAGFWIRAGAGIVDAIIIGVVQAAVMIPIFGINFTHANSLGQSIVSFGMTWVLPFVYSILYWTLYSATPGKMLFGLKLRTAKEQTEISLRDAIVRYLGYLLSMLALCIGYLWIGWDRKKQGWHDHLAQTVVIRNSGKKPRIRLIVAIGLIGFALLIVVGGAMWLNWLKKNQTRLQAEIAPYKQAGVEMGLKATERDCAIQAIRNANSQKSFMDVSKNSAFLEGCLSAKAPTKEFCQGIPNPADFKSTLQWNIRMVRQSGCQGAGCSPVFSALQRHCYPKKAR